MPEQNWLSQYRMPIIAVLVVIIALAVLFLYFGTSKTDIFTFQALSAKLNSASNIQLTYRMDYKGFSSGSGPTGNGSVYQSNYTYAFYKLGNIFDYVPYYYNYNVDYLFQDNRSINCYASPSILNNNTQYFCSPAQENLSNFSDLVLLNPNLLLGNSAPQRSSVIVVNGASCEKFPFIYTGKFNVEQISSLLDSPASGSPAYVVPNATYATLTYCLNTSVGYPIEMNLSTSNKTSTVTSYTVSLVNLSLNGVSSSEVSPPINFSIDNEVCYTNETNFTFVPLENSANKTIIVRTQENQSSYTNPNSFVFGSGYNLTVPISSLNDTYGNVYSENLSVCAFGSCNTQNCFVTSN